MSTTRAQDKVALVTGASAGIGLATADRLARAGWKVVGASRRGTGRPSRAPGPAWRGLVMDVDDDEAVTAGVRGVLANEGHLDAVVACAGWGLAGAVEQTPVADAKAQFETNFFGAVRVVQAALGPMRRQHNGRIVLVSSIGGVIGIPFQAFYSASKFAMEGYGEALAYEVAPFNIAVTLVQPGNVRTDFTKSRRNVEPQGDSQEDDPYVAALQKAVSSMARGEVSGASPESVAKAIHDVLDAPRPPRRVTVGKLEERAGTFAKRLLPYRVFERAAKSSLGI
ncbi:MAG: SDR family oxidoreductase [Acidimicrobiales bacterium]